MSRELFDSCWQALLLLARAVRVCEAEVERAYFCFGDGETAGLNADPPPFWSACAAVVRLGPSAVEEDDAGGSAVFDLEDAVRVRNHRSGSLPRPVRQLIRTYLPFCFSALRARRLQRTFAVSHFAQSLDGRIATLSGDSKWIGPAGNFVHAHRMRALSDGVMIGARTLRRDRPRLTVRHVPGVTPVRIILGRTADGIDCLTEASPSPVFLMGPIRGRVPPGVRAFPLSGGGFVPTALLLKTLYDNGILSVYIEGGAITASRFLREGTLDVLQVHIAPFILGSGIQAFRLPPVRRIRSSVKLGPHVFTPVDDGMMLIGAVDYAPPGVPS